MKAAIFSRDGHRLCEAPACRVPTDLGPFESETGHDSIALCMVHSLQLCSFIDGMTEKQRQRLAPSTGFHGVYYTAAAVLLGRRAAP